MNVRKSTQDRKAEILAATLDLAFDVGPAQVTTGMLAARLGLTQPAIYKHFPKKDDIWQAVAASLSTSIHDNIALAAQADDPPLTKLKRLVLGHLRLISAIPALPEIMASRDNGSSLTATRHHIHAAMDAFRAALYQHLNAANTGGQLRKGIPTADGVMLIFGIIQSLVLRLILTRNPKIIEHDGERLLDLQLALLGHEGRTL